MGSKDETAVKTGEKLFECCDKYECVGTTTTSTTTTTTTVTPPICSCTWKNPDTGINESHQPGAPSWTHGCIEFSCVEKMNKCELTQKSKACPDKPNCLEDEELCETQGACCKLYTCNKKGECKCGTYTCPDEPICNNNLGMFLSPLPDSPEHPCCNLYECTCQPVKCPAMPEKPTCTPGECETCEAIKVTKPGKCCPEWECECESTEVDNTCSYQDENGVTHTIGVDEHVYIPRPMQKCEKCACKLEGKDAKLKCENVPEKDTCDDLEECKPKENEFNFNFKCCPKRKCNPTRET